MLSTDAPVKPTGLKPVLEVIPEHCYQRSLIRGVGIVARDLLLYGLAIWGLVVTNNPLLLVPLWLLAGLMVSGLFVLGHDAAHGALFDSPRLNAFVARLTMLPSLHAVEVWIFGHNRVHHGHTVRQQIDFVWQPLTAADYSELGRFQKLVHRLEWSSIGAGAVPVVLPGHGLGCLCPSHWAGDSLGSSRLGHCSPLDHGALAPSRRHAEPLLPAA